MRDASGRSIRIHAETPQMLQALRASACRLGIASLNPNHERWSVEHLCYCVLLCVCGAVIMRIAMSACVLPCEPAKCLKAEANGLLVARCLDDGSTCVLTLHPPTKLACLDATHTHIHTHDTHSFSAAAHTYKHTNTHTWKQLQDTSGAGSFESV